MLLLYPRGIFYLIFLASQQLTSSLTTAYSALTSLNNSLESLRRRSIPVNDISSLVNAKVALFDLNAAVSARTNTDVTKIPAYDRMNNNINRFLSSAGSNVKSNGQIVPTPEESRKGIPSQVAALQAALTDVWQRAGYIRDALANYNSLNLAQAIATGTISRAGALLSSRASQLAGLTETARLAYIRQTVLELLGVKAVVKGLGAFPGLGASISFTGTLTPFSDATRGLTAGSVVAGSSPFALVVGDVEMDSTNIWNVWYNGAPTSGPASLQLFLPGSFYPKIEGLASGPFAIVGSGPTQNNSMQFLINGVTVTVPLTAGASRTSQQVAADLTAGLSAYGFAGEAYFYPLQYEGQVNCAGNTVTIPFSSFPAFTPGMQVDFYFGPNATQTRNILTVTTTSFTVDGAVLVASTTDRIRVGDSSRRVRVVPKDIPSKKLSISNQWSIKLLQPTSVEQYAGHVLGMYGELISTGAPTTAATIQTYIAQFTQAIVSKVSPTSVWTGTSRSEPSNGTLLIAYDLRTTALWNSGTSITLTLTDPLPVTFTGKVVLRTGYNTDATGDVTSVSPDGKIVTATFGTSITAVPLVPAIVEFGRALFSAGMSVNLPLGLNSGSYFVDQVDPVIPFQLKLRTSLPSYQNASQPVLMAGSSVGTDQVLLSSANTTSTASSIAVDPGTGLIGPAPATTRYLQFSTTPKQLSVGDFIQFYDSSPSVVSRKLKVVQIYADNVVLLSDSVPVSLSWSLDSTTPPFANVSAGKVADYQALSSTFMSVLASPVTNTTLYFQNLNAFINPLLVNTNPASDAIGAAESKLGEVKALLDQLTAAIGLYQPSPVPQMDQLIGTFKEKGADRAASLLLSCQFSTFFGISQDEASFAGSMQKAIRDVAKGDLPIHKSNRLQASLSKFVAAPDTADYETDTSDLDKTSPIDPPTEIDRNQE